MNKRIRLLRKELGLNQTEFGNRIGIKQTTVANYEIGTRNPIDSVVLSICKEFHVNEEWLRDGTGEMFKKRLPTDEVAEYVGKLLNYDGSGNSFYDMIIAMMQTYESLDSNSQLVIENCFRGLKEAIMKKKED